MIGDRAHFAQLDNAAWVVLAKWSAIAAAISYQRGIVEREAQLGLLQDELVADRAELERLDVGEKNQMADAEADQSAMAAQRWADSARPDE